MQLINILFLLTVALIATIVLLAELLVRSNKIQGENSRKFIHIIGGLIIAVSALYLSVDQLLLVCGVLTGGVLIIELPFRALHSVETVKRKTVGQYVFAVGIALVLIFFKSRALFMAATLTMTLADGLAAVVGARYGRRQYRFHIPGGYKTYLGSITFFIISFTIFVLYSVVRATHLFGEPALSLNFEHVFALLGIAFTVTMSEAIVAYGLDNISVPLLAAVLLNLVR